MVKARAKIVVLKDHTGGWWVNLRTDLPMLWHDTFVRSQAGALTRARAWARRLGGIPVEVEE
jgi:hypothetical protein